MAKHDTTDAERIASLRAALEAVVAANGLQAACVAAEEALEADDRAAKGKP